MLSHRELQSSLLLFNPIKLYFKDLTFSNGGALIMQSEDKERLERLASKLKGKQRAWADSYLSNGHNGSKASKEAGYKGSGLIHAQNGSQNLRKPHIKAYIDAFIEIDSKKHLITRESLLADIQIAKDCALASFHNTKPVGEDERVPFAQYPAYLKAIEMQAKMLGLNEAEKIDLTTGGDKLGTIDMGSLSEEALKEIANAPQSTN